MESAEQKEETMDNVIEAATASVVDMVAQEAQAFHDATKAETEDVEVGRIVRVRELPRREKAMRGSR